MFRRPNTPPEAPQRDALLSAMMSEEADDLTPREAKFLQGALATIDAITREAGAEVRRTTTTFLLVGWLGIVAVAGAVGWLAMRSAEASGAPSVPVSALVEAPLTEGF